MVLFFKSASIDPPVVLYMGKDKVENEDLIKYAWPQDVWFHVDKLSSAHVYLRMPVSNADSGSTSMTWDKIPDALLVDCAQLVKANSIEGNKKDDLTIIYTPAANLKKTGDMAVGQVSFHRQDRVKRVHIEKRENAIINRLNKTKVEKEVNHEQERADRLKAESATKRAEALKQRKEAEELAKQRQEEKAARSYDSLFVDEGEAGRDLPNPTNTGKSVRELEEDFM